VVDPQRRFEIFAAQVGETWREAMRRGSASRNGPRALKEDYWDWQSLHDLFTRDVTEQGLREMVQSDARDTLRFFTREIDFKGLHDKPWHVRTGLGLWRVFEAMAYRLSPARRILFAVSVPLLLFGWARIVLGTLSRPFGIPPLGWETWLLGAATVVFFLLVLELKDKLTLKGDLEIARQIQFGLLPFEPFARGGIAIETAMRPANTVGGDYFDIVELGDGRTTVVIGDVAGKGMPAALLMALLQGSLRTLITAGLRGGELVKRLNEHLCANIPPNRLITLFYAEVDGRSGEMSYVNAGHNAPFVMREAGGLETLPATAMALGILPGEVYEEQRMQIADGDSLLLYTDGITEAFDVRDTEYGEQRLASFLECNRKMPLKGLVAGVIADVLAFCGSERPRDDMTLLALGRFSGPPPVPPPS
jgi:hypothetical protein